MHLAGILLGAFIMPGSSCPTGSRPVTYAEANASQVLLCARLRVINTQVVARLAGSASVDTPSNDCRVRQSDTRALQYVLCVPGNGESKGPGHADKDDDFASASTKGKAMEPSTSTKGKTVAPRGSSFKDKGVAASPPLTWGVAMPPCTPCKCIMTHTPL